MSSSAARQRCAERTDAINKSDEACHLAFQDERDVRAEQQEVHGPQQDVGAPATVREQRHTECQHEEYCVDGVQAQYNRAPGDHCNSENGGGTKAVNTASP